MHPKTIFLNGINSAQCQSLNFSHLQNSCLILNYNQLREKELEKSLSLRQAKDTVFCVLFLRSEIK